MSDILSRFKLDGKIAIITGGGRGIGKSIGLVFAQAGAHTVIAEIDKSKGEAAAEEIKALGRKSLPLQIDVTSSEQVTKMVEAAMKEFKRIDILVNNVGGFRGRGPLINITDEVWNWDVNLNLTSTFMCSREVGRVMVAQNSGNIINISSAAGNRPVAGMGVYGTAKAAVIQFTQILACELNRHNIRVNCITPKTIHHGDFPGRPVGPLRESGSPDVSEQEYARQGGIVVGRVGRVDDVAMLALYLASDASSYITGEIIDVAGGPLFPAEIQDQFDASYPTLKL